MDRIQNARRHTPRCFRAGSTAVAIAALTLIADPAHAAGALNLIPDLVPLLLIMAAFLLLIVPLNQLLFKPLFGVLDEREARIAGARRRGDQLQEQAEEVLGRYQESVRLVRDESEADRRRQIERARQEHSTITAEARTSAEDEVERGREAIRSSLGDAREQLRSSAESLARDAAQQILGRSLT